MTGLPWYAHSIDSYERHTAHLTMLQHGAYRLMMDHYYKLAAPLPAKLDQLHRVCRAVADEERAAVSAVLAEYFVLEDDGWHNERADAELARMADLSEKRRDSAKKSHAAREKRPAKQDAKVPAKAHAKSHANAPAIADTLNTEQDISSLRSDISPLPAWMPIEAWSGFVEMRKKNRKPMTPRAQNQIIADLERWRLKGHDPTEILDKSTRNNWTDVYEPKAENGNGNRGKPTAHENFAAGAELAALDHVAKYGDGN